MQVKDRKIIDAIIVELNHFKFRRSSISYQYLIEAIHLVVKDPTSIKNFNKNSSLETPIKTSSWDLSVQRKNSKKDLKRARTNESPVINMK